ncbi:MAG: hypothetical protein VX871_07755 [Pseudomonadota bacterium]|nr:hypothetical protein [Pseudomonadota bacterium]
MPFCKDQLALSAICNLRKSPVLANDLGDAGTDCEVTQLIVIRNAAAGQVLADRTLHDCVEDAVNEG